MSHITDGVEFLKTIKFNVTYALYNKGYDFIEAEKIAGNVRDAIVTRFKGELLYIPNLKQLDVTARKKQVISLYNEGKTVSEITRVTCLSDRTVYTYIRNRNIITEKPGRKNPVGVKNLVEMKMHAAKAILQNGVAAATCKEISEELHTFLIKHWGGIAVHLPRLVRVKGEARGEGLLITKKQRVNQVLADYSQGLTAEELASKYSLDKKQAKGIVKRMKEQSVARALDAERKKNGSRR